MRKEARWLGALACALGLAAATPALGQDQGARHGARGHDPEKRIEHLREALDLTDDQVVQVRAIFSEREARIRELKDSGDRDGLHALHEEIHASLAEVLDETQREKLASLKREHGEGHRDHDGMRHGEHDEEES